MRILQSGLFQRGFTFSTYIRAKKKVKKVRKNCQSIKLTLITQNIWVIVFSQYLNFILFFTLHYKPILNPNFQTKTSMKSLTETLILTQWDSIINQQLINLQIVHLSNDQMSTIIIKHNIHSYGLWVGINFKLDWKKRDFSSYKSCLLWPLPDLPRKRVFILKPVLFT